MDRFNGPNVGLRRSGWGNQPLSRQDGDLKAFPSGDGVNHIGPNCGDDPGGVCFKFHRRPGFSAEATAIYIKGLTQFLPRTAAVKLFGQLVLALEGYDAIQTAVCAYIVVPVVNE